MKRLFDSVFRYGRTQPSAAPLAEAVVNIPDSEVDSVAASPQAESANPPDPDAPSESEREAVQTSAIDVPQLESVNLPAADEAPADAEIVAEALAPSEPTALESVQSSSPAADQTAPADQQVTDAPDEAEVVQPEELPEPPIERQTSCSWSQGPVSSITPLYCEGSPNHEFQDAFAYSTRGGLIAISDGVTNSCRSQILSHLLVEAYVSGQFDLASRPGFQSMWSVVRKAWLSRVYPSFPKMNWVEQKLYRDAGGRATFLGARIVEVDGQRNLEMMAIGDCTAFLFLDDENLVERLPEIEYNDYPQVLSTNSDGVEGLQEFNKDVGSIRLLVLATDAISEYLVNQKPWLKSPTFWQDIEVGGQSAFQEWCKGRVEAGELNEDDFTILVVRLAPTTQLSDSTETLRNDSDQGI